MTDDEGCLTLTVTDSHGVEIYKSKVRQFNLSVNYEKTTWKLIADVYGLDHIGKKR